MHTHVHTHDSDLPENSVLVSFDVPSIGNESDIKGVKKVLKRPPTEYALEFLRLVLKNNNSVL